MFDRIGLAEVSAAIRRQVFALGGFDTDWVFDKVLARSWFRRMFRRIHDATVQHRARLDRTIISLGFNRTTSVSVRYWQALAYVTDMH